MIELMVVLILVWWFLPDRPQRWSERAGTDRAKEEVDGK